MSWCHDVFSIKILECYFNYLSCYKENCTVNCASLEEKMVSTGGIQIRVVIKFWIRPRKNAHRNIYYNQELKCKVKEQLCMDISGRTDFNWRWWIKFKSVEELEKVFRVLRPPIPKIAPVSYTTNGWCAMRNVPN